MAADVAGLVLGMQLLEPSFRTGDASGLSIGRVRVEVDVNPAVDAAVDRALAGFGAPVTDVELPMWDLAWQQADVVLSAEAWRADGALLAEHPDGIGAMTAERILGGRQVDLQAEASARRTQLSWQHELQNVLTDVHVLAMPVLRDLPPALDTQPSGLNRLTLPVNFAGLPALSLPIGEVEGRPVAVQLIAPAYGEELLLSLGAEFEVTVG